MSRGCGEEVKCALVTSSYSGKRLSAYKDNLVKAIAEEGLASTSLPESSLTAFRAVLSLYYRTNSWITKNTETGKEEVKVDELIENYPEIALALVKDSHYSRLREAIKKYMTNKIADYIASKKVEEITFIIQDNDDTATEKLAKIHAVEKMSASEYLRYASKEGKDLDLPYSDEKFAQLKRTLGIVSYVIPKRTDEESER